MKDRILRFISKPTSIQVIINTLGNYFNVFFTALFALILVRILEPSDYGVLSVLLGIAYVLANLLDFGTTATIYSYLPDMIEKHHVNRYRFIKSIFFYQSLFSFIAIFALFLSFPFLDKNFFKTGAPIWELYLTSFSILFLIWQNFVMNCLFASKKFLRANLYLNASNIAKTVVIVSLMLMHQISVGSVIIVFGIVGPLIFFFFLFIEKRDLMFILIKSEVKREEFKFGYTLTYFVASQFYNLGLRMDLFLLSYFFPKTPEIGYYGLAQKVILTIVTTIVSITQVLSPMFAKLKTKKEIRPLLKTGFLYLTIPSALFFAVFILPQSIFNLFFTEKFAKTAQIAKALSLAYIVNSLGTLPAMFLLYTRKKPIYILIANIGLFLVLTIGCYIFIPKYGVLAPPWAIFASFLTNSAILFVSALYEYRKFS